MLAWAKAVTWRSSKEADTTGHERFPLGIPFQRPTMRTLSSTLQWPACTTYGSSGVCSSCVALEFRLQVDLGCGSLNEAKALAAAAATTATPPILSYTTCWYNSLHCLSTKSSAQSHPTHPCTRSMQVSRSTDAQLVEPTSWPHRPP